MKRAGGQWPRARGPGKEAVGVGALDQLGGTGMVHCRPVLPSVGELVNAEGQSLQVWQGPCRGGK